MDSNHQPINISISIHRVANRHRLQLHVGEAGQVAAREGAIPKPRRRRRRPNRAEKRGTPENFRKMAKNGLQFHWKFRFYTYIIYLYSLKKQISSDFRYQSSSYSPRKKQDVGTLLTCLLDTSELIFWGNWRPASQLRARTRRGAPSSPRPKVPGAPAPAISIRKSSEVCW